MTHFMQPGEDIVTALLRPFIRPAATLTFRTRPAKTDEEIKQFCVAEMHRMGFHSARAEDITIIHVDTDNFELREGSD